MQAQALSRPTPTMPSMPRTGGCTPRASLAAAVPGTFSEEQARLVLSLKSLPTVESAFTQMHHWTPGRFCEAQRLCVLAMLKLNSQDFCETLADAMAPCALRGQLMRARGFEARDFARLLRQI
jgi:hypothetical protein